VKCPVVVENVVLPYIRWPLGGDPVEFVAEATANPPNSVTNPVRIVAVITRLNIVCFPLLSSRISPGSR
jgi:hypothetical protein